MLSSKQQLGQASYRCWESVMPTMVPVPGTSASEHSALSSGYRPTRLEPDVLVPPEILQATTVNESLFCLNQQICDLLPRAWLIQHAAQLERGGTSTELTECTDLRVRLGSAPGARWAFARVSLSSQSSVSWLSSAFPKQQWETHATVHVNPS